MLYFEIKKIVIGLCSIAAVIGLGLGMNMNKVSLQEVIHSSHDNVLVYETKIKAHSEINAFNGTVVREVWRIHFIFPV